MKRLILLCLLLANIAATAAFAQKVDYNKIILPEGQDSIEFEERLIQLSWQNYPKNEVAQREVLLAEKNVAVARWAWTDNLRVFYNINDRTMRTDVPYYQPRYGLGLSINVGDFIVGPLKTRVAKENVKIASAEVNQQKIFIRAEVLRRYHKYLLSVNILKLRLQATEDAYSSQVLLSDKFKKGELSLEEYNQSLLSYSRAMEIRYDAESNVMINKASVEEMIGMRLEEVK